VTVYRALFSRGRLRAGEHLLVLGAGGGVATMAVLLASAMGATVTVTSSSPDKIAQARELGAAHGVLYTDADWPAAARQLSPGGRGFDLVLDSVGTWSESLAAVRPGGRVVVLGASRREVATLDIRPYYFGQYELIGTTMGSPHDFDGLLHLLRTCRVGPIPISSVLPLDQAAAAHRLLEDGSGFGKVILSID
jgi:NADPH:quinone reductase-like Zn-dependent oxidoreductase